MWTQSDVGLAGRALWLSPTADTWAVMVLIAGTQLGRGLEGLRVASSAWQPWLNWTTYVVAQGSEYQCSRTLRSLFLGWHSHKPALIWGGGQGPHLSRAEVAKLHCRGAGGVEDIAITILGKCNLPGILSWTCIPCFPRSHIQKMPHVGGALRRGFLHFWLRSSAPLSCFLASAQQWCRWTSWHTLDWLQFGHRWPCHLVPLCFDTKCMALHSHFLYCMVLNSFAFLILNQGWMTIEDIWSFLEGLLENFQQGERIHFPPLSSLPFCRRLSICFRKAVWPWESGEHSHGLLLCMAPDTGHEPYTCLSSSLLLFPGQ